MNIFLLLMIILAFALIVIWFKNKFWRNNIPRRRPSFSTSFALVRSSSFSDAYRSNTNKNLSVKKHSRDKFKKSPYSVVMQRRTLVNPRILEHKLTELEHLVAVKGLNSSSVNQRESNENLSGCTSSGGGH